MDGSYIHYTYDAAGTLLRKGYYVGEELTEIPGDDEEELTGFCLPDTHLMSVGDEEEEEELVEEEEEIPYTDVTDYSGNYVYENGTLKTILIEGGYITFDSNSQPVYHFFLQDHLGNNRVVANAGGQVEQVNHYYPYGGLMAESTGGDVQRYKYNGKELDRMLGLDWFDYGARHYDGALTMWRTMDPLCEKYYNISPYVYCGDDPINAFDPDGNSPFSSLLKFTAKRGVKAGIESYVKNNIEHRLKNYMSDKMLKQFAEDVDVVIGTLDNSWWENALELVPVVGDIYGSTKFVKQMKKAYDKLQDLENKYVGMIYENLSKSEQKRFVDNMRRKGVADARKDQTKGLDVGGNTKYEKNKNIDGHHKESVYRHKYKMTDPRVIQFMEKQKHIIYHQQYGNE